MGRRFKVAWLTVALTAASVGAHAAGPGDAARSGDASRSGDAAQLTPPELIRDSPAPYPPELAREALAGAVKLQLWIDEAGEVAQAEVVDASDRRFVPGALHAAAKLLFEPARQGADAVAVRIFFTYRFEAPLNADAEVPQVATIRGLVRTRGSRAPIFGASVAVSGAPVVETDRDGRFELSVPPGRSSIEVKALAHEAKSFVEELRAGETVDVIYSLMPDTIDPYQTIVRSDRERTEVSRVSLERAEVHDVPGTMGDPFRVVMLMPGVSALASGVAYPVVRGSQPASTGYFIDGIRVPILFHLFVGPAVVQPAFIDGIDFFPGVAPPEYGRLLGGVIDGRITRAHDDRVHLSAYADVLNAGALIEYPVQQTGTSITLAGRISYTPWVAALVGNLVLRQAIGTFVLDFWDYQARVEQKLGGGRRLRLLVFGSNDAFGLRNGAGGVTAMESVLFHRADLRYSQPLGQGLLSVGVTWGLDRSNTLSAQQLTRFELDVDQTDYVLYARYEAGLGPHAKLLAGADVTQHRAGLLIRNKAPIAPGSSRTSELVVDLPVAIGTYQGAWGQVVWTPSPQWTLIPGLRVDNYHLTPGVNHLAVEPRVTALHPLGESLTLKAGAGLFHQAPTFVISVPVIDVAALRYGIQEALQVDAGVEWRLHRAFSLNVDAYVNPMFRTLELDVFDTPPQSPELFEPGAATAQTPLGGLDLGAHGYAYGVEVMLRHPLGDNWFGWLSYSFQRSARYTMVQRYDAGGLPTYLQRDWVDFAFDQTHVVNAVISYRFAGGWTVGGALHFNSGRPELGQLHKASVENPLSGEVYDDWVPTERTSLDRLPPFFRLDARVAKAFAFEDFTAEAYLDVLNVSLSPETFGYTYERDPSKEPSPATVKLPAQIPIVLPVLGVRATY